MLTDEIERKLAQAIQLLGEASNALAENKRAQAPAQVMSRIQSAQAMRTPVQLVTSAKAPARKERAHFYLRIAAANDPTNDEIWRVVGDAGLIEASRMQAQLASDPQYHVERLDSRSYDALRLSRLRMVREGAAGHVGCMESKDLRGPP